MEKIDAHLENRFEVRKARSPDQERAWNRADAVIEITKWLYLSEVMQMTAHLEPHKIISLMDYARKHGDKPKSFFRYLVNEEKKQMPVVRSEVHGDVPPQP